MIFNGHTRSIRTCLDVGNLYSVVFLLVYLDAVCVYDTLNTELGKSWNFGLYHAINRFRRPLLFGSVNFGRKMVQVLLSIL